MFFLLLALAFGAIEAWPWEKKDPEVGMTTPEIVRYWGYEIHQHNVVTMDGYNLTMFRMPNAKGETSREPGGKPVVLLQHALLDSSFAWVLNLPHESLAYILADLGYDVWLGNNRGNKYSRSNVKWPVDSKEFWDFSWDEMALYDLPAEIDYILNATGKTSLSYVGHSEGTIQMFAALGHSDYLHKKVNYFAALGPVAWTTHLKSLPLELLADLRIDYLFEFLGMKEFLADNFLNTIGKDLCFLVPGICNSFIELICGKSERANKTRMDIYIAQTPSGTSVKNMAHWAQGVRSDNFQMFDYGSKKENQAHYKMNGPPQYNLTMIDKSGVPISLYSGSNDLLADPTDVSHLETSISNALKTNIEFYGWAHLDFTWAADAYSTIYPHVITDIKSIVEAKKSNQ